MPEVIQFETLGRLGVRHFVTKGNFSLEVDGGLATRKEIADWLGFRLELAVGAHQTHSDNVRVVTREMAGRGAVDLDTRIEDCDALVTNVEGICIFVQTADCVPILLYDKIRKVVATVHAGWSTASNIVQKAIRQMSESFSSNPKDVVACIGPSIRSCCFEVGDDVAATIGKQYIVGVSVDGKPMLDLQLANKNQLEEVGVVPGNIETSVVCTCCGGLPSWRRQHTMERIATGIVL